MAATEITYVLKARNEARRATKQFADDLRQGGRGLREVRRDAEAVTREFRKTDPEVKKIRDRLAQTLKETRALKREMSGFRVETQKASDGVNKVNERARGAGRALAGLLGGVSIAATLADALRVATEFEASMSQVKAITQSTGEQFEALSNQARALGATTSFSAAEAAAGMTFLAQAGFNARQAFDAIPVALDLAKAGSLDLARSADIASNVLSGLGLTVGDFGNVADVLAFTAANANTNIEQLGQAFKFVAPQAAALNKNIDEVAAAIGVLSDAGLQGSLAGTYLRGIFSRLLTQTPEARKELQRLGVSLVDIDPQARSLQEIIDTLADAIGTDASAAAKIFGAEASTAFLVLASGRERLRDLTEGAGDSEGALKAMAAVMGDNLQGAVKELRSAIEELYLSLTNNGTIATFVQFLTALVREITPANDGLRELADGARDVGTFMAQLEVRTEELRERMERLQETARIVVEVVKGLGIALGVLVGAKVLAGLVAAAVAIRNIATAATFANIAVNANPLIRLLSVAIGLATALYGIFSNINDEAGGAALQAAETRVREAEARVREQEELLASGVGPTGARGDAARVRGEERLRDLRRQLADARAEVLMNTPATGSAPSSDPLAAGDAAAEAARAAAEEAARRAAQRAREGSGARTDSVLVGLRDQIADLQIATEAYGRERAEILEVEQLIRQEMEAQGGADVASITTLVALKNELEARGQIADSIGATIDQMRAEREAIEAGLDATGRYAVVYDAFIEARKLGLDLTQAQIDLLMSEADALREAADEADTFGNAIREVLQDIADEAPTMADQLKDVAGGLENAFESAFDQILTTGKLSFADLTTSILKDLARIAASAASQGLAELILGGVGSIFTTPGVVPSAKGNAFSAGRIIPFARGGVVSSPTMFPMAGSQTGLMGEAGPEAILPLSRGPGGRLGVEASGVGQTVTVRVELSEGLVAYLRDETQRDTVEIVQKAQQGPGFDARVAQAMKKAESRGVRR